MIRINLIPYRAAKRQQQIMQHLFIFGGVILIAALLSLAAYSAASMQLYDLKDETVKLQQQNAELKKKIGKIQNLDNLRANVQRKLDIIDRLQEGRFRSLKTLNEIAQVIPDNVWIKSVKDSGDKIELTGLGESNKAVANFMRKLDSSPLFTDIQLLVISRVLVDGLPVRSFSLNVNRADENTERNSENSAVSKRGGV
ncbi:type IV pilus assembly protein PilN [Mariprofundus ferrinatatus]|uniref:Type IV pilus assembly protein PilN n=1 Tax=Mariprofundus ferrinatatus TaxID=1921087 RepID=A0A2K8L5M1_9PROT|nr:PilN domain-containing protein [Mariprofundus ferrinatatus]ATX82587.1 type IV pilus assembly protein PilN [Mariprofundus ferrinatatus]